MKLVIHRLLDSLSSHQIVVLLLLIAAAGLLLRMVWPQADIVNTIALLLMTASLLLTVFWRWSAMRKRPGMLLFHGMLAVLLLALLTAPLLRVDAYFELAETQTFRGEFIFFKPGRLHPADKPRWDLTQGDIHAEFKQGTQGYSINTSLRDAVSSSRLPVKFQEPVRLNGYRISPTGNMGYAAILTYISKDGRHTRGVVNFPSYPNARDQQQNQYVDPEMHKTTISLQMTDAPYRQNEPWYLHLPQQSTIRIKPDWRNVTLKPGQEIPLQHGRLRYDGLVRWLGYTAVRDPLAPMIFVAGLLCLLGIGWHIISISNTNRRRS